MQTFRKEEPLHKLVSQISSIIAYLQIDLQLDSRLKGIGVTKQDLLQGFVAHRAHILELIQTVNERSLCSETFWKTITFIEKHLQLGKVFRQFSTVKRAAMLVDREGKLEQFILISSSALSFRSDITAFPLFEGPSHYRETYQSITRVEDPNPKVTQKQMDKLQHLMDITNAAVTTELQYSNSFLRSVNFAFSYPYFFADNALASLKSSVFLRKPKVDYVKHLWGLPEQGVMDLIKHINFQSIKTNKVIFVPKDPNQLNLDVRHDQSNVQFRIISPDQVPVTINPKNIQGHNQSVIDTVIIHIHGGGFLGGSSSTMQSYTRRWANQLKATVLAIDYCKPPEHRFPQPLQDVYTAYNFVVSRIHHHTNIRPRNIILAGDSAGGNMACALMGQLLRNNIRLPNAVLLTNPAVDLRKVFSPSRLSCFSWTVLHPALLSLCLEEYLGADHARSQFDPLASPLLLTEEFVGGRPGDLSFPRRWPATRIMVGDLDPLMDDSLRLTNRMVGAGVDVHCWVYQNMPHGFLSMEQIITHSESAIKHSIEILKELIELPKSILKL